MPESILSDVQYLDHIHSRIEKVFLRQLTHRGRFCELYHEGDGTVRPVGIWGWNTWCGIHDLTPLVGDEIHEIMRNTFDEGLSRPEAGTGLLPHAVPIDRDGRIGYRDGREDVYYRTYSGIHGEDYCLDNIICWSKMALEYFLYTRDTAWLTTRRIEAVERSTDYILDNYTTAYDPHLIESGIEGDWTENTNWHADNSNNNVCMVQCLDQLAETESLLGRGSKASKYARKASEIRQYFTMGFRDGGFWFEPGGYFLHGNDGIGQRVYGDRYFESTANYYSILWDIAGDEQVKRIWQYADANPDLEAPLPVLTNHRPKNEARRMNYGHTVTDGDIWLTLGAHAAAARLREGCIDRGTQMVKAILDYELRMGTIHNSVRVDGTYDWKWTPEIGNYGSIFTVLVEGVLGLRPTGRGLRIDPRPLRGMSRLETLAPLGYAGKEFTLKVRWKGGTGLSVALDGRRQRCEGAFLLGPDYEDGSEISMVFS
jgi:hypothetical protein